MFGLEKRAALHSPPREGKERGEFVRKGKYKKGSLCAEQCKKVEENGKGRGGRSIAKKVMKRGESRRGTAPFSLLSSPLHSPTPSECSPRSVESEARPSSPLVSTMTATRLQEDAGPGDETPR